MRQASRTKFILVLAGSLALLEGCSSSSDDETDKTLDGKRFRTTLVRGADEIEWVTVSGAFEWWFFKGGVFRQIGSDYVEPQFYGPNQACNGTASGAWRFVEPGESDPARAENEKVVSLAYDGARDVKGLCRMTDREIKVFVQPSGAVDILDNLRVTRVEFLEKLR